MEFSNTGGLNTAEHPDQEGHTKEKNTAGGDNRG